MRLVVLQRGLAYRPLARIISIRLFALLLTVATQIPSAHAWSAKGHDRIARAAYAQLTPAQQRFYVDLLAHSRISVSRSRPALQLGALAKWPDQVREQTLQQLFNQYGSGKVPRDLAAYSGRSTKDWHYENALFLDGRGNLVEARSATGASAASCPPTRNGQMFKVWPRMLTAYDRVEDPRDKILLLSLLLHFSGDAHQPLHSMGALKPGCKHDGGGNGFCVAPGPARFTDRKSRCQTSLHRAWDGGFDVFNKEFAPAPWRSRLRVANLESVLKEHRRWAGDVYPNADRTFDSPAYQARARAIVSSAASRAVAYQTLLLKDLSSR